MSFFKKTQNILLVIASTVLTIFAIELCSPLLINLWQATYRNFISDKDKFYIYCVGGSTMQGYPFNPKLSPGKTVSKIFNNKINDKEIVIVPITKGGEDFFSQYMKLKTTLALKPEKNAVILLYSGLNEVLFFHEKNKLFFDLWKKSMHSIILQHLLLALDKNQSDFFSQGNNSYSNYYILSDTLFKYQYLLDKTIATAKENNIPIIISTLTSNICGFNPMHLYKNPDTFIEDFRKILPALSYEKSLQPLDNLITNFKTYLEQHTELKENDANNPIYINYLKGFQHEKDGQINEAILVYKNTIAEYDTNKKGSFSEIEPLITATHFRLGKCFEYLQQYNTALNHFKKSLPTYVYQGRLYLSINKIIRSTAAEQNIPLTDTFKTIETHAKNNLPNWNMFTDGHHPNIKSLILLSYSFAEQISKITNQEIIYRNLSKEQLLNQMNFTENDLLQSQIKNILWQIYPQFPKNDENLSVILNQLYRIKETLQSIRTKKQYSV